MGGLFRQASHLLFETDVNKKRVMRAMSIMESLFVGVFGMGVVFIVLYGLGLLLRLQSALINHFSRKITVETTAEPPVWDEIEAEAPALVYVTETHYTEALDTESELIVSPGPGRVLDVKAYVGKHVKNGDILLMLDAMDMEYEIDATRDGTVTKVLTAQGACVDRGTPLIEIQ